MTAARKVPPHIARELARHVKPSKTSTTSSNRASFGGGSGSSNSNSKARTVIGCFAFVGVTASIPLWAMKWIGPLNEKDGALTGPQIRRGAFNNSGSRDVGKDPNWDFRTGTRIQDKEYKDLFLKDKPNEVEHGSRFVHESKQRR